MTALAPKPATFDLLRKSCALKRFAPGEILREQGQHYRDMFLIADGSVAVELPAGPVLLRTGSPVGEIGYLKGLAATATVTAHSDTDAIVIDDATLERLDREQPALAVQLLRYLADTAEERISHNLTHAAGAGRFGNPRAIEVFLCRDDDMLERARRLRYEVYCEELGRNSPNADHGRKIIADDLDRFGNTFIAVEGGETIGTIRGNISFEGPLGILQELYGMAQSPHHPHGTSVVTKFVVRKAKRGGLASFKLISALTRFGLRNSMKECYIDSIPSLLHYYKALGFTVAGEKFFHRENGPSIPMKLDLVTYGEGLSRDPGTFTQLQIYLKAQSIRLMDRMRARLSSRGVAE